MSRYAMSMTRLIVVSIALAAIGTPALAQSGSQPGLTTAAHAGAQTGRYEGQ